MKNLHFSIVIRAPRAAVWNTMLGRETYKRWTDGFAPESYYEGSWDQGATIRFLIPSGDGMVSTIAENRLHEFVSIKHLGYIHKGVDDTTSDAVRAWAPAFENYSFTDHAEGTEVQVDINISDDFEAYLQETWPKALEKLKTLCEAA